MKKVITLALALLMVLAVAVPTLAFTTDEYEEDSATPYELGIILVDYDEGYISKHVLSLPETNRGYLKNEVIAAVVSIYVPKGEEFCDNDYTQLVFGGENVDLNVTDNYANGIGNAPRLYTNGTASGLVTAAWESDDNTLTISGTALTDSTGNADSLDSKVGSRAFTINVAFFGKATGDDGLVYAELNKDSVFLTNFTTAGVFNTNTLGAASSNPGTATDAAGIYRLAGTTNGSLANMKYIVVGDYVVLKISDKSFAVNNAYENAYLFFDYTQTGAANTIALDELLFVMYTDSKDRGKIVEFADKYQGNNDAAGYINMANYKFYEATLNYNGDVLFADPDSPGNFVLSSNNRTLYNDLVNLYEDDFMTNWGFDLSAVNNVVKESFFTSALKVDNLYDEVTVEPFEYTLEVVVPDEVIIDPPKVG